MISHKWDAVSLLLINSSLLVILSIKILRTIIYLFKDYFVLLAENIKCEMGIFVYLKALVHDIWMTIKENAIFIKLWDHVSILFYQIM